MINAAGLDDDVELWRYMALGPFLTMITSQALYQTRVDAFDDLSEGAYGYKSSDLSAVANALRMQPRLFSDNQGDTLLAPRKEEIIVAARATAAVTCWFTHDGVERFAMWKIYARDTFGVAIVTTLGALRRAFEGMEGTRIDLLKYEPLPSIVSDVHTLFFHKRAEYRDEQEIRSVNVLEQPLTDAHPSIALRPEVLDALIGTVITAPGMSATMFESLRKILSMQFQNVGLTFGAERLRRSKLDDDRV